MVFARVMVIVAMFLAVAGAETLPLPATAESLERWTTEAHHGSTDAMLELAYAFDRADKSPWNQKRAAEWYQKAADAGVGIAALRLGQLYETGDGVIQSYAEALRLYEAAVAGNVPEASMRIGILYLEGWGVARDPQRAHIEVARAAEAGYLPAHRILSGMYAAGIGVKKDLAKALYWAERAGKEDDPDAQSLAGRLRGRGLKLMEDRKLAREWFQLSSEQAYTEAMLGMAATYAAERTSENLKLAIRWLELATEAEDRDAPFILAKIYGLNPKVTASNLDLAQRYLKLAAERGNGCADEVLGLMAEGSTLASSLGYFETVSYEQRYVERFGRKADTRASEGMPDRPPRVFKIVRPSFPLTLRFTKTEGQALVSFVVDKTGRVQMPRSLRADHPAFGEAAVKAVSQWLFEPALKGGRLVNTRMRVPIKFSLSYSGSSADRKKDTAEEMLGPE